MAILLYMDVPLSRAIHCVGVTLMLLLIKMYIGCRQAQESAVSFKHVNPKCLLQEQFGINVIQHLVDTLTLLSSLNTEYLKIIKEKK